ncbi:MAG: PDZ domain-containing protein, partial [Alphaproteobacteria bacterium]
SAIFTKKSDANIGVNFVVSARLTNDVALQLKQSGRVKRPISGMKLEQALDKGGTGRLGVRIVSLRPGFIGEKAGLKAGDIILRAAGRRLRKPADFVSAMSGLLGSDTLEIEIDRGGAVLKLLLKK